MGATIQDFDPFAGRIEPHLGRIVSTDTVSLWCHDTGNGEPLVLVGGFTAGHFAFDFLRPYLPNRRLITWEPRGLGQSARPQPDSGAYGVAVWAEDLRALLDALGIYRVHMWACGFGSYISLRFAATYPERLGALITYTDVYASDPAKGYASIWEVYSAVVRNFGVRGFGARVLANVFDMSGVPWFGQWEARNIEQVLNRDTVEATVGHCLLAADVRDDLRRVVAPTLVIQGDLTWDGRRLAPEEDRSLALMRESIPNLGLASISGAHPAYVLVQQPERCAEAANAFLDAHASLIR